MNDNTKKLMFFLACMVCSVLAIVLVLRLSTLITEVNEANVFGYKLNIDSINMFSMIVYGVVAVTIILAVITFALTYIDKPGCIKAVRIFKNIILVFLLIVSILTLVVFIMDINKIDNTDKTLQSVEEVFDYTTMFTKFTVACQFLYNSFVVLIIANACSFFAAIEKYKTIVDVNKVIKDIHKEKQVKQQKTMEEIDAKLSSLGLNNTKSQKPANNTVNTTTQKPATEVRPKAETTMGQPQSVNPNQQRQTTVNPAVSTTRPTTISPAEARPTNVVKPTEVRPQAQQTTMTRPQTQATPVQRPTAQPTPTQNAATQPTQRPTPTQQPQQRVAPNPAQPQAPKVQNPGDKK